MSFAIFLSGCGGSSNNTEDLNTVSSLDVLVTDENDNFRNQRGDLNVS